MTLEREGYRGPIVLECDECSEILETHCTDFEDARDTWKSRGWRAKRIDEEWIHLCKDCEKDSPV